MLALSRWNARSIVSLSAMVRWLLSGNLAGPKRQPVPVLTRKRLYFRIVDTAGGQIVQGFPWRGEFRPDMALQEDGLTCLRRRPHRVSRLKGSVGFKPGVSFATAGHSGFQPIASSFLGGATRGWPIRSQIAPWPVAMRDILIKPWGTGSSQGGLPWLPR